jgi:hypothetical protein
MASTFDLYAMVCDQQNRIAREDIEASFESLESSSEARIEVFVAGDKLAGDGFQRRSA